MLPCPASSFYSMTDYDGILKEALQCKTTIANCIGDSLRASQIYARQLQNNFTYGPENNPYPSPREMEEAATKLERAKQTAKTRLALARDCSYELDRAWKTLLGAFDPTTGDVDAVCSIWSQKPYFQEYGLHISAVTSPFRHYIAKLNECEATMVLQFDWYEQKMQKMQAWLAKRPGFRARGELDEIIDEVQYQFDTAMMKPVAFLAKR